MPKPFAAFDVDGTIFKSSLAEKVVGYCIDEGIFSADAFNDVEHSRSRWQANNNEGVYQAYLHRLVGAFVTELTGVEVERFNAAVDKMIADQGIRRFSFPKKIMKLLQNTHEIIAISGSPTIIVKPFLADLPVQDVYGSILDTEDGRFTGTAESVGDKAHVINSLVASKDLTYHGSVAIGDTYSDVPMLHRATHPIMFNASHTLTKYGSEFGWARVHEVKDQVTTLIHNGESEYKEVDTQTFMYGLQLK